MWLDTLKQMKKKSGKTSQKISDETGISKSTIDKLFIGRTKDPSLSQIRAIVHCLGYTLDDLTEKSSAVISISDKKLLNKYHSLDHYGKKAVDGLLENEYERCINEPKIKTIELPFSELKVSAGIGEWLDDESFDKIQVRDTPEARKADIVIEIDGESMEPKYSDGDKILVHIQPAIELGSIGIFIKDNKGYIKQYAEDRLVSLNPEFDDIYPDESSEIRCIGKVIGKAIEV